MIILRDLSVLSALFFRLFTLYYLFESRYPKRKTILLFSLTLLPLTLANFVIFLQTGPQIYMTLLLLTLSLPSLIILGFLTKNLDGRFVFTQCLVDTITIEIVDITNIIEYYLPGNGYLFTFFSRVITYLVLSLVTHKYIRPIYREVQQTVKKGWHIFAVTALTFYIAISLFMSYPTLVTERPHQIPALLLLFVLMPIVYFNIFKMLRQQQINYEISEQKNILRIQVESMTERVKEVVCASQNFRIERHDLKHKIQTIAGLLENKKYDEIRSLLAEYDSAIDATQVNHYCTNVVIDTVLSSYLQKAEQKDITVKTKLNFPMVLPVPETDLSIVFANAIDNAIYACEKLPVKERFLEIQVLTSPRFMFQISNSFSGVVTFDQNNLPVCQMEGHGIGTRSIATFCNKHGAYYEFKTRENIFILQIVFPN